MAGNPLTELTNDLGRALLRRDGADLADAQLLTRFAERGDEAAFEALFRRHAPMVLGVCRRLLRNAQDAEDAVQVVFLVLAQKAASVRPREAVAGWLYGVARKAALKARAAAARRKERPVAELPEPPPRPGPGEDLWPLLERELSRLPEKYRAVVVLCDLEGRSRREAARLLGWPEGTVCGRLARARALLARRLGRSGVTLSGATVAALAVADPAPACVSAATLRAVLRSASPHAASAATVPPHVLTLVRGVRRALWLGKLKVAAAALAGAGLLGAGVGVAGRALHQGPGAAWQGSVAAGAPATPAHVAPADVRTDAQRLRGVWELVWLVNDGNKAPEDQVRDVRLELTDTAFRSECAGPLFRESTYTIDPTRDPRRLDFTSRGDFAPHVCQAIYQFEGDRLVLCYPRSGAERPALFESKPGSGLTLTLWRRVGK
jgi:RNA polymerase sigma factor (sigma-70 family)